MIEIDVVKASAALPPNQSKPLPYFVDYTDLSSDTDTALNTPTGSITDSIYARHFSTSSIKSNHCNYQQRKPSIIPKSPELVFSNVSIDQQKIHALEIELQEHIKRESVLKSQLLVLAQRQGRTTLSRISKHIDRFLTNQQQHQHENRSMVDDEQWVGNEIPALFGDVDHDVGETSTSNTNTAVINNHDNSIPVIFVFRLKAMIDHFTAHESPESNTMDFCADLHRALDAWQAFYYTTERTGHQKKIKEQERITRLLEALRNSVLKNKMMEKDHALLIKEYESDMNKLVKERKLFQKQMEQKRQSLTPIKQQPTIINSELLHVHCRKSLESTKTLLESQIKQLDNSLLKCQEERDEYETTLEMVRREMETMLEELEDTRQQRIRYKSQASRLRAGLEAIRKKRQSMTKKPSTSEQDDDCSSEEDEATESMRLMYNEAERQAVDLDRECKRQTLSLNSIRKELRLTEEKYQSVKTEKSEQLKLLEQSNRTLTRRIELLEVEKNNLILIHREQQRQQHHLLTASYSEVSMTSSHSSSSSEDVHNEDEIYHVAKIHALQVALQAAKSDAVLQRVKISQLQQQASLVDLTYYVNRLQEMFQKELDAVASVQHHKINSSHVNKETAISMELEQRQWKQDQIKAFQKQLDIDLLRAHREVRSLSFKLTDLEDEASMIESRHMEELALIKHQSKVESERKLQKFMSSQRKREQELRNQLEILYQKNQTLQEESMILYGRNMLMAHKLGKIAL